MQGNEFRMNGVPTAAPRSAAIHLHPGNAFKLLRGLGKKRLYSACGSERVVTIIQLGCITKRQFVSASFSTYQISSGQPYFIRSSSVGIKVSMSKAQDLINNKSNYLTRAGILRCWSATAWRLSRNRKGL